MTRNEFAKICAYLSAACGKPLSAEGLEVYYDLLGDLSFDVFLTAAKRVLLAHPWPNFPSIAELREAAAITSRGLVCAMSPDQAWEEAWRIVRNTDPEVEGSFGRASAGAAPAVVDTIRAMGLDSLCFGREPISVVRAQFVKFFEARSEREQRHGLLPAKLLVAIEANGPQPAIETMRPEVAKALEASGLLDGIDNTFKDDNGKIKG